MSCKKSHQLLLQFNDSLHGAVMGRRIFLGLRGPVLRSWAVILEVQLKQKEQDTLKLKKIGKHKQRYRKHLVNLQSTGRQGCTKQ